MSTRLGHETVLRACNNPAFRSEETRRFGTVGLICGAKRSDQLMAEVARLAEDAWHPMTGTGRGSAGPNIATRPVPDARPSAHDRALPKKATPAHAPCSRPEVRTPASRNYRRNHRQRANEARPDNGAGNGAVG